MTYANIAPGWHAAETPQVRRITVADLMAALRAGYADFTAMPTFAVFLVVIYPVIGLVMARVTMGEDLLPLAYPLCAGFALIGPFAALGLYELSKRREQTADVGMSHAFDVFKSPSLGSIAALGAIQMIIFVAWNHGRPFHVPIHARPDASAIDRRLPALRVDDACRLDPRGVGEWRRIRLRSRRAHAERRLVPTSARSTSWRRCGDGDID